MNTPDPIPSAGGASAGGPQEVHVLLGRHGLRFFIFARFFVVGTARTLWRVRVRGIEKLPPSGGYVLAPSHRSMLDIPFTSTVTKRRVHYMGKRDLWKLTWAGSLWDALGAFPVDKDGSRPALRAAKRVLDFGEPLVVFPEGTRNKGPELGEIFHGTAWMAARSGVPIVPIGIGGSEYALPSGRAWPKLGRVAVIVGDPIPAPSAADRAGVAATTDRLRVELQRVFNEANALAAGHDERTG